VITLFHAIKDTKKLRENYKLHGLQFMDHCSINYKKDVDEISCHGIKKKNLEIKRKGKCVLEDL
jgi:hypothetical protein